MEFPKEMHDYIRENHPNMANNPFLHTACYATNNNYAYKYDIKNNWLSELKIYNFVPTHDTWCLTCENRNAKLKCGHCKSVYFCNKACQKRAWPVHKNHCKRDLFSNCSACFGPNPRLKCNKCPVKWCNEDCKKKIYKAHQDFDCEYFARIFKK
jgi:hypothetical protein